MIKLISGLILIVGILTCHHEAQASNDIMIDEVDAVRHFGWVTGDTIERVYQIKLPKDYHVLISSLPQLGQLNYWLDVIQSSISVISTQDDATSYQLSVVYQAFYAPLDVHLLTIPALSIIASNGTENKEIVIPEWSFTMSPLKATVPLEDSQGNKLGFQMMADVVQPSLDKTRVYFKMGVLGLLLFILLCCWLFVNGLLVKRTRSPFLTAYRIIKPILRKKERNRMDIQNALFAVHHAFDAVAKKTLFSHQIDQFSDDFPEYRHQIEQIKEFYTYSSLTLYQSSTSKYYTFGRLISLCKAMADAEKLTLGK